MINSTKIRYIDSHFHLDIMTKKINQPISGLLPQLHASGMLRGLDVSVDPRNFYEKTELVKPYPFLFLTAGMYPSLVEDKNYRELYGLLKKQCTHKKVIALGEIGLDYFHDYGSREEQKHLFFDQLNIADSLGLPVVLHNREAAEDILEIIKESGFNQGGILHCFSGSLDLAQKCIDLGFCISFAGNVTYKKNTTLQEVARKIPIESLLVETDAPYLSPQSKRGTPNHPGNIPEIIEFISNMRNMNAQKLAEKLLGNFFRLFPSTETLT